MNWLTDTLRRGLATTSGDTLRRGLEARRFDRNNFEHLANKVAAQLGTSPSQYLAIANNGLGLDTRGLIIGGQRDDAGRGARNTSVPRTQQTGASTAKSGSSTRDTGGARGGGREEPSNVVAATPPRKTGVGGITPVIK